MIYIFGVAAEMIMFAVCGMRCTKLLRGAL